MRETWIVQSKLTPPSPPAGWLERALLPESAPLPPVSVLVAGPGYGKTLGLLSMASRAGAQTPVVWYSLDFYDADPATFFHYMVAGVQAHIPQFGDEVKALLVGEKLDPRLLWQRFLQSVASYNLPSLVLVLDDLHQLFETQSELIKALAYFFDKLPPRVHILLGSRQRVPVPLGRLQTKGLVRVWEQEQLRFSATEEHEFLKRRAPEGAIPDAWLKQAANLDGWPLGLDLTTTLEEGLNLRLDGRGSEALTEYVAEELLGAQSEERRQFMLKGSLLTELTPEACRWVFQALDAADQLSALEADHLVQRLADGVSYRFPTYLRDYLQAEAERTLPGVALANYHRRAAAYFQDAGREELAIPHLVASRDFTGAAVSCDMSFPAMRFNGRQSLIKRWLEVFPADVALEEPVIQLWWGHFLSRNGQHDEALPAYDRAAALFEARDDVAGLFKVQVRQCTLALIQQDMKRFGQLLMKALALQTEGRNEDVVDLCLARALAAEQRGDMALMHECNEAVLGIPVDGNIEIAASHVIALMNLYTYELHRGNLAKAHQHIAQAIELADGWHFYPYHLFASFLQANLRLCEGDLEAAGAFVRQLPPHWGDLLDWHDLACAYAVLGYYHQAKGDWKESEEALRKSYGTFERAGFKEGLKVPLERMLWLAVSRKQYVRTAELIQEAGESTSQNIYDMVLQVPYARALHLAGGSASALRVLDTAIPALTDLSADLHLAKARLYEAAARLKTGETQAAETALTKALAIAEARDYGFLTTQDQVLWEELAPLVARTHAPQELEVVVPAAPIEAVVVAPAEPELVTAAPTAPARRGAGTKPAAARPGTGPLSLGKLTFRAFGGFEVRLDGVMLDQWPRRKAKLILAALMLHARGLTLTQLAEALGVKDVTPATLTTLKVDVSALRRTLEPALGKGDVSRYVEMVEDRYVLAWDQVDYLDLKGFDAEMALADSTRERDPLEAAAKYDAALVHYRGNLLEDTFFQEAFEPERERYRFKALSALHWLAEFHGGRGDNTSAETALRRAVELSPCDEASYVALMRLQRAVGKPERIRQVYWDCRKALKQYLGLTPSDEFESAYQQIAAA
jgi:ATP/maltotriose-dependent transcriptional regulator MalT/DNA-binding SARP family transcriptional activator